MWLLKIGEQGEGSGRKHALVQGSQSIEGRFETVRKKKWRILYWLPDYLVSPRNTEARFDLKGVVSGSPKVISKGVRKYIAKFPRQRKIEWARRVRYRKIQGLNTLCPRDPGRVRLNGHKLF